MDTEFRVAVTSGRDEKLRAESSATSNVSVMYCLSGWHLSVWYDSEKITLLFLFVVCVCLVLV